MDITRCSLNWGQSLLVDFPKTSFLGWKRKHADCWYSKKLFLFRVPLHLPSLIRLSGHIHYYTGCERTPSLGLSVFKVRFDHNFCQMVGSHCIMHETPGCFIYLLPEIPPLLFSNRRKLPAYWAASPESERTCKGILISMIAV